MKRSRWALGILALAGFAAPVAGQSMSDEQAIERGRELIAWWWDAEADKLWQAFTPAFQTQLGDIEPLLESRDEIFDTFGGEAEVLKEVVVPAGDNMAYWRVIELEDGPEPFVLHLILQPDGLVALGRGGFESEMGGPPE